MFPPLVLWKTALTFMLSEETEAWRCEVSPRGDPSMCFLLSGGQGNTATAGDHRSVPQEVMPRPGDSCRVGEVEGVPQPPVWQDLEVGLPQVSRHGQSRNQAQSHRATEPPPSSSLWPQQKSRPVTTMGWGGSFLLQGLPSFTHFPALPESTGSAPFSPSSAHPTPPHPTPILPLPPRLHPVLSKKGLLTGWSVAFSRSPALL